MPTARPARSTLVRLAVAAAALAGLALGGILAAGPAAARPHRSPLAPYRLTVRYVAPICGRNRTRPLDSARLVFLRGRRRLSAGAALSAAGSASFRLSRQPVQAYALLDAHQVVVLARAEDRDLPHALRDGRAYLPLGRLRPGTNRVAIRAAADRRAANVFSQLQQHMRFSAPLTVRPLKRLPVRVDASGDVSSYSASTHRLTLTRDGAFDDTGGIGHEFGHYLMFENIAEARGQAGDHTFRATYPDKPGLAFYEGWGWAYAAIEHGSRRLPIGLRCADAVDLGADAPTYAIGRPHYAQYNEEMAAYVLYHLAGLLGAGNLAKGLGVVLHAFATNEVNGRDPETMRDLRDALLEEGVDQGSQQRDDEINEIFADYGMQWGIQVLLTPSTGSDDGALAFNSTTIEVTGPHGFDCRQHVDEQGRPLGDRHGAGWSSPPLGPLAYTYVDDCIVDGGPDEGGQTVNGAYQRGFPDGYAALPLPYLAGGAEQLGAYTVTVRFSCHDAVESEPSDDPPNELTCAPWHGSLRIAWLDAPPTPSDPDLVSIAEPGDGDVSDPTAGDIVRTGLTIPLDRTTPVVSFTGDGRRCRIALDNTPCYPGPGPTS